MKKESKIQYKPNPFLRIIRILLIVSFAVYVATGFLMHVDMRSEEEKEKEKEYRDSIINRATFSDVLNIVKTHLNNADGRDEIASIDLYRHRKSSTSIASLETSNRNFYYYRCTDGLVVLIDFSEYEKTRRGYLMEDDFARQKWLNIDSDLRYKFPYTSPYSVSYWRGDALNIVIEEATEDKN